MALPYPQDPHMGLKPNSAPPPARKSAPMRGGKAKKKGKVRSKASKLLAPKTPHGYPAGGRDNEMETDEAC